MKSIFKKLFWCLNVTFLPKITQNVRKIDPEIEKEFFIFCRFDIKYQKQLDLITILVYFLGAFFQKRHQETFLGLTKS